MLFYFNYLSLRSDSVKILINMKQKLTELARITNPRQQSFFSPSRQSIAQPNIISKFAFPLK